MWFQRYRSLQPSRAAAPRGGEEGEKKKREKGVHKQIKTAASVGTSVYMKSNLACTTWVETILAMSILAYREAGRGPVPTVCKHMGGEVVRFRVKIHSPRTGLEAGLQLQMVTVRSFFSI